jgi:hypothetical protein
MPYSNLRTALGLALGLLPRQTRILNPFARALGPLRRDEALQPCRGDGGQIVERRPQRLSDEFQPMEHADGRQDMRRIGALRPTRGEHPQSPTAFQELRSEELFSPAGEQAAAFAQDGTVEAGVREVKTEPISPGDAGTDGLGRLAIGEGLAERQDGDEGEAPRRQARLATPRQEGGEGLILEEHPELVAQGQIGIKVHHD